MKLKDLEFGVAFRFVGSPVTFMRMRYFSDNTKRFVANLNLGILLEETELRLEEEIELKEGKS